MVTHQCPNGLHHAEVWWTVRGCVWKCESRVTYSFTFTWSLLTKTKTPMISFISFWESQIWCYIAETEKQIIAGRCVCLTPASICNNSNYGVNKVLRKYLKNTHWYFVFLSQCNRCRSYTLFWLLIYQQPHTWSEICGPLSAQVCSGEIFYFTYNYIVTGFNFKQSTTTSEYNHLESAVEHELLDVIYAKCSFKVFFCLVC